MKKRPKMQPSPASLLRMWLLLGGLVAVLFGGSAAYVFHAFSRLQPDGGVETARAVRAYRERRLPELEAVADRQELLDELGHVVAKTERFLRQTNAREENLLHLLGYLPRLMALCTCMLLLILLLGYGYLRTMKCLCERQPSAGREGAER